MTAFHRRETAPFITEEFLSRPAVPGFSPEREPARPGALGRAFAAIKTGLGEYLHRQRVLSELSRLSDRELADMGLTRGEIREIFTPEFAARHNVDRSC